MKNIKKLFSLLLCGIMLFGMFPASLFAADGDTGDGSGTISETFVPEITWKRTFEYEHRHDTAANQHTDLRGLYAGDKTDYLSTESETENSVTTYKNKVHWDWAAFSEHFNGRTDDVDDSAHKVWDYGHTDVQYADPVKDSITNPINSSSKIGGVGIIPYAPSASEQAIFAATWNNRAAQNFTASSVDGTGIYYPGNYVSVKKGQMDIGYGRRDNDGTNQTFSGKSYTARKFSGSFVWPEGYTLSDSIELISKNDSYYQKIYDEIEADPDLKAAFGGKKVVAINDDMFVFVYKDGEQLTENNYRDYLAFFAGTAGKGVWSWPNASPQDTNHGGSGSGWGGEWNVTEPATYGDKYASKAFYKVLPNLDTAGADRSNSMLPEKLIGKEATSTTTATAGMMALSDYWYSFMDGNAISTVLNNKYGTTGINAGDTVHIDIYCIDMDKVGGMDELEIRLTRQKPTTSSVTVRYWLNAVGATTDGNYLGSTIMTGQEIGSLITLANGTDVNQLNHKRAAAITENNGGDVSDGSQQAPVPFTVKENSEENIIDVVYLPAGAEIVHFYAGNKTYAYTGQPFTVSDVTIKQGSYADIVVADSVNTTTQQLNEPNGWGQHANYAKSFTATKTQTLPGIYPVTFSQTPIIVNDQNSNQHLTNYTVYTHPGSLTITYAPSAKVFTYDFGVQNSYSELLNDVEKSAAEIKVLDSSKTYVSYDKSTNALLYTPQSVNSGETIDLALVFAGGYQVKKSITFLPATNVLYEENFMTNGGTHGEWIPEGTNNTATVVNDNENSVYGYADAYKGFATYSNGGALKATLDLKGGKRAYTTDAVEFSFSGTGFDIISECGTDTGLLLVALSKGGNPFKVYIVDTYFCGDNSIGGNPIITGPGILDYQVPVVRAMNLERADYSVRILGYLTNTAGAIVGPASPTPWDGGETGAAGSTRGANGIDTNRILREAGLKEFIGCEVETSFMDENSVLNGGTGIAAKNSQNRTFGKRGEETAQTADVYLDAFRVYQPLADETKYVENEQDLAYAPVYDYVKNSADLIPDEITDNSMVYVEYDGDTGIASIANYHDHGPQNEVYLTNGNYIGFALEDYTEGDTVMISAKAVAGEPILGYLNTNDVGGKAISSDMKMTEMYYDVTACVQQYGTKHMLVLGNIAEAGTRTGTRSILSVSGIKLADRINPATSTQIAADIASLVTLAYQPVEEPVFTPERFELRYSGRALAGWFTSISVKTSTDVDHVSVYRLADDGSLVPVRENMRPMNSLFTYFGWMDYYAFSLTVRAPRRGMTDTYYIFAYDANGVASEPAIASITGR